MGSDAAARAAKSTLVSAVISGILCLVIFATLRFYSDWFNSSHANTILGGFLGSWLFVLSLTSVSNVEMVVFGADFQVKFIPEIVFCLTLAVIAAGVVHRVCATTCILFSIVGLFFVNRISSNFHNKVTVATTEPLSMRKASSKKTK